MFEYMEPSTKRAIIISVSLVVILILGFFIWYQTTFTYKPGETEFVLTYTEHYSDKEIITKIQNNTMTVEKLNLPSRSGYIQTYELEESDTKMLSDYLVRKKRFFLSLDHLMGAKEPTGTYETGQYKDTPNKYTINIRYNGYSRKLTDYSYSRLVRMIDMTHFIKTITEEIINEE